MVPKNFNVSGIVDLDPKPPIAWVHGTADPIVSDTSFYDFNYLGQLGIVPGWPGAEVAPPQEMVSQTRDVLDAYAAAGGEVTEVALEGVGHSAAPGGAGGVPPRAAVGDRLRRHAGGPVAADRGDHPQVRGLIRRSTRCGRRSLDSPT